MVLEDICNADVYHKNAFYLLGLNVNAAPRKIRRRHEDLMDGALAMGESAWNSAFDKYLLGRLSAPSSEDVEGLFEKLKDPEFYATELFFWFWPQDEENDIALAYIEKGERDAAIRIWMKDVNREGEVGIIARHNLAVALHYYAIDGEKMLMELATSKREVDSIDDEEALCQLVDNYWKAAFKFWDELVDDYDFWELYSQKVYDLNDPRLDDIFIEDFRSKFAICFDGINASFLVDYVCADHMFQAKRHLEYMISTMSDEDDIGETLENAFQPMAEKVKILIRKCDAISDHQLVVSACEDLLKGSAQYVKALTTLFPKESLYAKNAINDIVTAIENKLPLYGRETGDYKTCLDITRRLLKMAATPMKAERIKKTIEQLEILVKKEREKGTCIVCGKFIGRNISTKEVKLYSDLKLDPSNPNRYVYQTLSIHVPVCSICSIVGFKEGDAKKFSQVKDAVAEGWKIGAKPTQAEIDRLIFM